MDTENINIRQQAWKNSILRPESAASRPLAEKIQNTVSFFTENRLSSAQEIIMSCVVTGLLATLILIILRPPMVCSNRQNDWEAEKVSMVRVIIYVLIATCITAGILTIRNFL